MSDRMEGLQLTGSNITTTKCSTGFSAIFSGD